MPRVNKLIDLATNRGDEALRAWQQLSDQCTEAMRKLALLKEYRERYRGRMDAGLEAGMPATSMRAYLDFIGQIDEVLLRQETGLGTIEQACAQQWEALVNARREQRTFEILGERLAAKDAEATLRRRNAEIDDLIQRAASMV